jgi:hypothetical protein
MYFTVVFVAKSNGEKLRPYTIFKNSQITKNALNPYPKQIVVRKNERGWINEKLMIDWIDQILLNFQINRDEILCLCFDKCTIHEAEVVQEYLKKHFIKFFYMLAVQALQVFLYIHIYY